MCCPQMRFQVGWILSSYLSATDCIHITTSFSSLLLDLANTLKSVLVSCTEYSHTGLALSHQVLVGGVGGDIGPGDTELEVA